MRLAALRMQWKAKCGNATCTAAGDPAEKVAYLYAADNTLRTETFSDASGTRRVVNHESDAFGRETYQSFGGAVAAADTATARGYDRADNLVAIGVPYTGTQTGYCGVAPVTSPDAPTDAVHCTKLEYDAANRLTKLTTAAGVTGAATICLNYDNNGNVSLAQGGCTTGGTQYTTDDFGNVILVRQYTNSMTANPSQTWYEYGALGNVVTKKTTATGTGTVGYSYDSLGRMTSATSASVALYNLGYDGTLPPVTGLPARSNLQGRLSWRQDSFGVTAFSYDEAGNVVAEYRVRAGSTAYSPTDLKVSPTTAYAWDRNGNLTSVTYPHGRTVAYGYGALGQRDRVTTLTATRHNGVSWAAAQSLISAVQWEPYGGLRGYSVQDTAGTVQAVVDYQLGAATAAPSGGCTPVAGTNDNSGLVRQLAVTTPGATPLLRQQYQWKGGQLAQEVTCFNGVGQTTPYTKAFTYDGPGRLTSATGTGLPVQSFPQSATYSRGYSYDTRSNRSGSTVDGCSRFATYDGDEFRVQGPNAGACNGALSGPTTWYDGDGRAIQSAVAWSWWKLTFDYSRQPMQTVTDSVYRGVNVTGGVYAAGGNIQYFFDAVGRRRYKAYSLAGISEEYFYGTDNSLLEDTVSESLTANSGYTTDDFVWLAGRPVAMMRGSASTSTGVWARRSDDTASCTRLGEAGMCGTYFIINDRLPKPVLLLNALGQTVGTGTYDEFGHVNRIPMEAFKAASSTGTLATVALPTAGRVSARAFYSFLDYRTCGNLYANGLLEWDSATTWAHRWGQWVPRNASNALTLTRTAGTNMALCVGNGIEVMSVDYRQMQSGLSGSIPATWVPFRFPGQVYDAETDMFENFNRDYFPDLGTYLSSEPLLQDPSFPAYRAGRSLSTPTYAYASNNPVGRVDRDGRGDGTTADDWWFGPLAVPGVAPYAAGAVAVGVVGAATVGTIAVGIDQFPDPGAGTVEPPGGWPQPAGPSVGVGTAAAAAAVAGAAIICQMAKGGKQNLANEWSRRAQQEPDPCKWLRAMYAVADASDRMKIKIAEKFLGCRGSSGGGP